MKKICIVIVGLYCHLFGLYAQAQTTSDSSVEYRSKKLKFEEANIVSSYYHQDGNNAAVLGGAGSEKLTDIANGIDLKFTKYDKKYRLHTFTADIGIDTYTSASSDMIDLKANSSASSSDVRIYPSISWSVENEKTGNTIGLNASSSTEFDYQSYGVAANFSKKSKDNNKEFSIKTQLFLDQVSLVTPVELRTTTGGRGNYYATSPRNTFSTSLSFSQIVNKRLQLMYLLDVAYQSGLLSLPFHRVYFNNGSLKTELMPSTRFKVPIGIRANYFLGDKVILRSYYRFYKDDWGLTSNTAELETVYKINSFFSVSPFVRYYNQSGVDYFGALGTHKVTDNYYTSNYDLSKFNSVFLGSGIRYAPVKGIFGIQHVSMIELRYGHYARSTNLNSNIISMNLKFK